MFRLYYIIVVDDIIDKCYEIELILCLFFRRYEFYDALKFARICSVSVIHLQNLIISLK